MSVCSELLKRFADYDTIIVRDGMAFCCGSSGSYSLLEQAIEQHGMQKQILNFDEETGEFMVVRGYSRYASKVNI